MDTKPNHFLLLEHFIQSYPFWVYTSENAVEKLLPGVYAFDSQKTELLLIKNLNEEEILNISKNIYGENLSDDFFCYSGRYQKGHHQISYEGLQTCID